MTWSLERAEAHLLGLELFGMRFGLDRMRRLLTVLGSPQERYRAIHVVGTNGKSSTVRMTAAILEAHGVRTGSFLSPHLTSFAERVRLGDADLAPGDFGAAIERAAAAAAKVDRTLEEGDRVTQFELLTAAALAEFARRGVELAVVEAGLGGRWDATNVLAAPVVVLTNAGLEHTRWLGPTVTDIACEKLAVVPRGATLVVGDLDPEAATEAAKTVRATGARLVRAPGARGFEPALSARAPGARGFEPALSARAPGPRGFEPALSARAPGALRGFQRANFAVARAAAEAWLGSLDEARVAAAAARVEVPGRMQVVAERPLTLYDGAHNPSGVAALAGALPDALGGRRPVVVVSVLDDKDAAAMLRTLLSHAAGAVFTRSANPRALSPATLASLAGQLGGAGGPVEIEPDPRRAVRRAQQLAGPEGAVVATGSIYLVADLLTPPGARARSAL